MAGNSKRIYLIGFMGSGKTSLVKRLANKLGYEWRDIDADIESATEMDIPAIFSEHGEDYFRKLEAQFLRTTGLEENMVVSCGGGTPCFEGNMLWMNENGITIYLEMTPKAIYSRIKDQLETRPLLQKIPEDKLLDHITEMLEQRLPFYEQSQLTISGLTYKLPELVETIKSR